jgi:hypothetical protein
MRHLLETLAFTLLIGGQFLAAVVTASQRCRLYPDAKRSAAPVPLRVSIREAAGR